MAAVSLKTTPADLQTVVKVTIWVTAQVETEASTYLFAPETKTISDTAQTVQCVASSP